MVYTKVKLRYFQNYFFRFVIVKQKQLYNFAENATQIFFSQFYSRIRKSKYIQCTYMFISLARLTISMIKSHEFSELI